MFSDFSFTRSSKVTFSVTRSRGESSSYTSVILSNTDDSGFTDNMRLVSSLNEEAIGALLAKRLWATFTINATHHRAQKAAR